MTLLTLKITDEQRALLKQKAFFSGLSMSALIRQWIESAPVTEHPSFAFEREIHNKIND